MKLEYMKYLFTVLTIILLVSCKPKENILITGVAHKNDIITIFDDSNQIVFEMTVNTSSIDISGFCVLYEETKIYKKNKDFKLRVVLDSSSLRLVDTIVVIKKENIEPFILFSDPKDVGFKRKIFIDDDSKYIKY